MNFNSIYKKYRKYFIIVFILILHSCSSDFLDTKIDVYETPKTVESARANLLRFANAMYTQIPYGLNSLDGNLFAVASDEAVQTSKFSTEAFLFNQGIVSSNNLSSTNGRRIYKSMYEGIRAVHFFLEFSENYQEFLARNRDLDNDMVNYEKDIQDIKWFRAEAHVLRAYYYFELFKRWGKVPIVHGSYVEEDEVTYPESYDVIVNYMVNEIEEHEQDLQEEWRTSQFSDQSGRFDQGAALALKSKILLFAASPLFNTENNIEKWKKAAKAAHDVISLGTYGLESNINEYFIGNKSISSKETIFASRKAPSNSFEKANYPITTPGGKSGVTPSDNLVESYEYIGEINTSDIYLNRDPRLYFTIVTNGSQWNGRIIDQSIEGIDNMKITNTSRTGYYLKKFMTDNLNLEQGETAQHPWIIFRYAEILLNFAEAMNEAYGPDDASNYSLTAKEAIQLIRNRASELLPAKTSSNREVFREYIVQERKIELAFEDHRFWDLTRWLKADKELSKPIYGVQISKNNEDEFSYERIVVENRFFPERMFLFPFEYGEIINSNGNIKQNPGY